MIAVLSCSSDGDLDNINPESNKVFADEEQVRTFIAEEVQKRFAQQKSDKNFADEFECDDIGSYNIDGVNQQFDFTSCYYRPSFVDDDYIYPEYFTVFGFRELASNVFMSFRLSIVGMGIPQTGTITSSLLETCYEGFYCYLYPSVLASINVYEVIDGQYYYLGDYYSNEETFEVDVINGGQFITLSFKDEIFNEMYFYRSNSEVNQNTNEAFYNGMSVSADFSCCLED